MVVSIAVATPTSQASHRRQSPPTCTCSASVRLSRPQLSFSHGTLTFIPTVDISIRSRGDAAAPPITAQMSYAGSTSYASSTVPVPAGVSFTGQEEAASGMCGSRFTFRGRTLPAVDLTGITDTLVGVGQKLTGTIKLNLGLTGCGHPSTEQRMMPFSLRNFGTTALGSWRSARQ